MRLQGSSRVQKRKLPFSNWALSLSLRKGKALQVDAVRAGNFGQRSPHKWLKPAPDQKVSPFPSRLLAQEEIGLQHLRPAKAFSGTLSVPQMKAGLVASGVDIRPKWGAWEAPP